jgi:hypothetical protein
VRPRAHDDRRPPDRGRLTVAKKKGKKAKGRRVVRAKSKCCKDRPRCKKCPVVLKRLEQEGYAVRIAPGEYEVIDITKKALAAARARPA